MTEVKLPDAGGDPIRMLDVGGYIQPIFFKPPEETKRIFDNVPNFKFRDDDLMLCTFPKTGTNWMFEVLRMALDRSAERVKSNKTQTMIELVSAEEADSMPSPRVINCHYPPRYLPISDMKAKHIKTVLCLRNPKDTAVSYFNHMKGIKLYEYDGKWENWLPVYVDGKLEYGKYSEYLLEWQNIAQSDSGFPLHIMYYEDLKMNGEKEFDRLLQFLCIDLDDKLKKDILHMCKFDKMAAAAEANKTEGIKHVFKEDFKFHRKGQVGDWANWFTVAQNEIFDKVWKEETKDISIFKFKYTPAKVNS